jgi:hypothetical protein
MARHCLVQTLNAGQLLQSAVPPAARRAWTTSSTLSSWFNGIRNIPSPCSEQAQMAAMGTENSFAAGALSMCPKPCHWEGQLKAAKSKAGKRQIS